MKNKNSISKSIMVLIVCFGIVFVAQRALSEVRGGWYSQMGEYDSDDGDLDIHSANGVKIMMPYNGVYNKGTIGNYLNKAAAVGIKVWVGLRLHSWSSAGFNENDLATVVYTYKNYPALEGWYITDEPEYNNISAATVESAYNVCKQNDPNHPVSGAHAWTVKTSYMNGYDNVFLDVYPCWGYPSSSYQCGTSKVEFCYQVRESYKWWNNGISTAHSKNKAFTAVPVGFGSDPTTGQPQNGVVDLTVAELRYHVLTAVALGADDVIFWWDQNDNGSMVKTNDVMRSRCDAIIGLIDQIGNEMKSGTTNSGVTINQTSGKILYRYGQTENDAVILAVNISRWDAQDNNGEILSNVQFTLPPGAADSQVEVLGENRKLSVVNGVFTDNFDRFAAHAYRLITGGYTPPKAPSGFRFN